MQHNVILASTLLVIIAWSSISAVSGDDYLRESPSFLRACQIHGNEDDQCLSKAIENIFTNWKDGIPGLKTVGSIDPFHVKKVRLAQSTENLADIQLELRNAIAYGMSKTRVIKSAVNDKDYTFKFHLQLPSIRLDSDYKVKGRILLLNLDGTGTVKSKMTDLDYVISAKTNLKKIGDEYFFDVLSVTSDIKKIGNFHVEFTNLFNGNKALEDSTNQLFNDSWSELFELLRPAISQTLDAVIFDRYKKVFAYIPARFFISDLP